MPNLFCLLVNCCILFFNPPAENWKSARYKHYTVFYQQQDRAMHKQNKIVFKKAYAQVTTFFQADFKTPFAIYLHPDRASMDRQWQVDWKMPDFKSECWMVASGVATRLDLLSPRRWAAEACEHRWENHEASEHLIAHEMTHVFHGQYNISPDFSDTDRIDWFVEGLATYASGQCDSARLAEVKKALVKGEIPTSLDQFWSGKLKYGLSGSVVLFLDQYLGRAKLLELLSIHKKEALLQKIGLSEAALLAEWKSFVVNKS